MLAKLDTLTNVKFNWTIDDLFDAHEALDIKDEAERFAMERAKSKC